MTNKARWFFSMWATVATLTGGALMSYHQPFKAPTAGVLGLIKQTDNHQWTALHILSARCGCSRKVLHHLLQRRPFGGLSENILMVDGGEQDTPEILQLLAGLTAEGFRVAHLPEENLPDNIGLRGVPLLVFASPDKKVSYAGGYGADGDQDGEILQQIQSGLRPGAIPILGCAVGAQVRARADPLHFKY